MQGVKEKGNPVISDLMTRTYDASEHVTLKSRVVELKCMSWQVMSGNGALPSRQGKGNTPIWREGTRGIGLDSVLPATAIFLLRFLTGGGDRHHVILLLHYTKLLEGPGSDALSRLSLLPLLTWQQ